MYENIYKSKQSNERGLKRIIKVDWIKEGYTKAGRFLSSAFVAST